MPISNAIRATESEMEYIEKYRQVQFIAKQVYLELAHTRS